MAPAAAFILGIICCEQKDIPTRQLQQWRDDWARLGPTGMNTHTLSSNKI